MSAREKIGVIAGFRGVYPVSAMCEILGVTRSLAYYTPRPRQRDATAENAVIEEFVSNYKVYGARKIRRALLRRKLPIRLSRRKISGIMKTYGLTSKYMLRRKRRKSAVNEDLLPNIVNREFDDRSVMEVVVSDLTYVKVAGSWHYICLIIDLAAREIIGFAAGRNKDAKLVRKAIYRIGGDLRDIEIFHTDRGSEFKNEIIDEIILAFGMKRSLSAKGRPHDNAVAESMYNVLKTEMTYGETYETLDQLELRLFEFVNWYNNRRIHGSLGYTTPAEYREQIKR